MSPLFQSNIVGIDIATEPGSEPLLLNFDPRTARKLALRILKAADYAEPTE